MVVDGAERRVCMRSVAMRGCSHMMLVDVQPGDHCSTVSGLATICTVRTRLDIDRCIVDVYIWLWANCS
jgi:hypothetical protein